jgi:type IV secretion system protein VirB4
MNTRWSGPAAWARKEKLAGDRLPYARHLDDRTIQLRDGAVMSSIHLTGLPFETEDADQLNHNETVREVMLRSVLDARFVLYHHIVRRLVRTAWRAPSNSPSPPSSTGAGRSGWPTAACSSTSSS